MHLLNDQNCYWQSICSEEIVQSRFFIDRIIFFEATSGERFFFAMASCLNFQDNMLTEVFSSTIRTVIGSQFVREILSIRASFLTGELNWFSKPPLVDLEFA